MTKAQYKKLCEMLDPDADPETEMFSAEISFTDAGVLVLEVGASDVDREGGQDERTFHSEVAPDGTLVDNYEVQ